ncbi:MAG: mannitol dehydrogenase family protein [Paraglaciecola sp.]|uniref:Mannitol dehydrogenase family protein n=1 Tax=Alishewanella maricola TaxID=2795740 RepID=A0ABS8C855_9ALTE|nr:mannitol dehydrogenase family protein [Alishewanella maricola]MCB5228328.1 mannitol dehydrogenase family protein [Alishewanella maricola]MDP5133965.1 mannitol dehydrogenase family protein [Paraglaciecola sp.]
MIPLSIKILKNLNGRLLIPAYRLAEQKPQIGIVHLGPGAFFRGHQAWYTEQALKFGGDWAISAVSMRSPDVSQALMPQDGLYILALLDVIQSYQVIGAISEVLIATEQYPQVFARLTAASTKYVTMTITEKGYCLNASGTLDLENALVKQDLSCTSQPVTAIGLLYTALEARFQANIAPFCVISCDNLTDNGHKLRMALIAFAEQKDPTIANWLSQQLISPLTMVDSITPATDDAIKAQVGAELGVGDNWPIKREAFVQWVIEDVLPADRPAWQQAGVIYAKDVTAFEKAKLRLLNAPHSALAYVGSLLGYETVFDAMQDNRLTCFVQQMINEEIIPSFTPPTELDINQYSADILARFRNPAIRHLLAQIAWDGSQKLPMRILPAIGDNLAAGKPIDKLAFAIAAWCRFIVKRFSDKEKLVDPLSEPLLAVAAKCNGKAEHDVALFLAVSAVFPAELAAHTSFNAAVQAAYHQLVNDPAGALLAFIGEA